jgi:hypothetical protein
VKALQSAGGTGTSSSSTVAVTTNGAAASGNFIIGVATTRQTNNTTLTSVSGGGLTWTVDATLAGTSSNGFGLFSAPAPAGLASSTTVTATFSAAATRQTIALFEFSGIASNPAHSAQTATNTTGPGASATVTLTGLTPGDLVIGGLQHNASANAQQVTAGTGFTQPANGGDTLAGTTNTDEGALQYLILASGTSQAIAYTMSASSGWSGGGVAYSAAPGATPPRHSPFHESLQLAARPIAARRESTPRLPQIAWR